MIHLKTINNFEFKSNNKKIIFFIIIFSISIPLFFISLLNPDKYVYFLLPNKILVIIVSLIGFILFPYAIYFFIKFYNSAIKITNEGIYNGLSFLSLKFISWEEIIDIKFPEEKKNKRIAIIVKNPEKFLKNNDFITSYFSKLEINYYKTPIFINFSLIDCDYEELKTKLIIKWEEFKNNRATPLPQEQKSDKGKSD